MPICGSGEELKLRVVVTGPPSTGCTSLVARVTRGVFPLEEDICQQRQQTARIDIGCQVSNYLLCSKKSKFLRKLLFTSGTVELTFKTLLSRCLER